MTVHEEWTDQLSDYLDGELSPNERSAVEAHLRTCEPCAAVLNDLRRLVSLAQGLEPRPPEADLWAGIAERIDAGRPAATPGQVVTFARRDARRFAFMLPQLAAAAALLMAVSGVADTVWRSDRRTRFNGGHIPRVDHYARASPALQEGLGRVQDGTRQGWSTFQSI